MIPFGCPEVDTAIVVVTMAQDEGAAGLHKGVLFGQTLGLVGAGLSGSCLTHPLLPPCLVKHDPLSGIETCRNAWVRMATLADLGCGADLLLGSAPAVPFWYLCNRSP